MKMKRIRFRNFLFLVIFFLSASASFAEDSLEQKHSVCFDPLTAAFSILIVNYGYRFNKRNEVLLGLIAGKEKTTPSVYIPYPGNIKSVGILTGYRFYFWKGLHLENDFMFSYKSYNDTNTMTTTPSFGIYDEIRLGYLFEFQLWGQDCFLNLQWPVGFSLYDSQVPESFATLSAQDPIFYIFFPNTFFGMRF